SLGSFQSCSRNRNSATLGQLSRLQQICVVPQEGRDCLPLKSLLLARFGRLCYRSYRGLFHFFRGRQHFLRTIRQAVHLLGFRRTLIIAIECRRSEEHTSELQSPAHLVCRPLL